MFGCCITFLVLMLLHNNIREEVLLKFQIMQPASPGRILHFLKTLGGYEVVVVVVFLVEVKVDLFLRGIACLGDIIQSTHNP
jgi:hypothetical protein